MSGSWDSEKKKQEIDPVDKERQDGVGHGELYSPNYAIRKPVDNNNPEQPNDSTRIIGQGELYSPNHAVKHNHHNNSTHHQSHDQELPPEEQSVVAEEQRRRRRMRMLKDKLLEKLSAATTPSDEQQNALDNAKRFIESLIRDMGHAAQGITKDALQKIKSHLAHIFPSLSPSLTSKIVDDAENEVIRDDDEEESTQGGRDDENEEQVLQSYQGIVHGKLDRSPASSVSVVPVVSKL